MSTYDNYDDSYYNEDSYYERQDEYLYNKYSQYYPNIHLSNPDWFEYAWYLEQQENYEQMLRENPELLEVYYIDPSDE